MSEIDRILNNCTECGLCIDECDFLKKYALSPKALASRFKADGFAGDPAIPYSCNNCTLCKLRCPEGLDTGKMAMEMRRELVRRSIGPLPQHTPVMEGQAFYVSDAFRAAIPSSNGPTQRVFFPGCSLSAYSPGLVGRTYEYLSEKLPGTGLLLGCCGGPAYLTGDSGTFEPISKDMASDIKSLGATQVIAACPFCLSLLKQYHPDLNPVSLYEVLDEIGVPSRRRGAVSFNVHDPCTARYGPGIHDAVRSVMKKAGFDIVEIPHSREESHCCGMGGMVYVVDAELGRLRSARTLDETDREIVTYCATCRETLQGQGGHVVHLLDLVFNPRWKSASGVQPKTPATSTRNLKTLKKRLASKSDQVPLKPVPR